jgi:predicted RNA-binding Zn-ribbon protein involved in translation (DUF1610 family)
VFAGEALPEGWKAYLQAFDAHLQARAYSSIEIVELTRETMIERLANMGVQPRERAGAHLCPDCGTIVSEPGRRCAVCAQPERWSAWATDL